MPIRAVLRATGLGTVLAAALLSSAGCGSNAVGSRAGASPSASPSSLSNPSSATPSPVASASITPGGPLASPTTGTTCAGHPASGPVTALTLNNSSNGGIFCISLGQRVIVQLHSKPSRMWSPIKSDTKALVRVSYGNLMLRVGETGASFAAQQPGIAHLSSARLICPSRPVHCGALMAFQVTVMVGGVVGTPVH